MATPRTLYDKIWQDHLVDEQPDGTCLIYIDRHLVHEVTSPQAFEGLRLAGRKVRAPEKTLCVVDRDFFAILFRCILGDLGGSVVSPRAQRLKPNAWSYRFSPAFGPRSATRSANPNFRDAAPPPAPPGRPRRQSRNPHSRRAHAGRHQTLSWSIH